jgi:hypothetical protein
MTPLPLVLAGPIVRRVEPTLASVWIALRDRATVMLKLWEGRVTAGSGSLFVSSEPPGARTLTVGANLHVTVAKVEIPPTSPRLLQPGKIYSYDLEIQTDSGTHSLKSLGLLTSGEVEGKRVEALGFEENFLPGFALPPDEITDLRVLFGSCRRPGNTHMDAMMWIDDLMRDNEAYSYKDPLKRPHQMFLGGDQIYADDVTRVLMHMIIDRSKDLIGGVNGVPFEHIPVDSVRHRLAVPPANTELGFDHYAAAIGRDSPGARQEDFLLPADHAFFPAGRRYLQTVVDAQMTSTDGKSHLLALGEFAAMYCMVWCNALWPTFSPTDPKHLAFPTDADIMDPTWPDRISTWVGAPLNQRETRDANLPDQERKVSPFHSEVYLDYEGAPEKDENGKPLTDDGKAKHFEEHLTKFRERLAEDREMLRIFEHGLPKVRRALANIPTYMIFDDHDFTDDWNLNPMWYDRVYATSLGVTTARNALVSYALFQDWGNDPLRYEKQDDYKNLLATISNLFPDGQFGPNMDAANELDRMFGFRQRGVTDPVTGRVAAINPVIKWHFSVSGPKHLAIALDNRTRRSFVSRLGPPGNVEGSLDDDEQTAQTEQIPAGPFTDGKEILLVVAPLQVLGPPVLDELVAPAAFRAFDIINYSKKLDPRVKFGTRGMVGTDPDAIEAWAFDPTTFEALLKRVEPYRSVVFLSGDVHYSASTVMNYFTKGQQDPARIVQFTSSGFKNVMPSYITVIDRSIAVAHKIVRANIGAERMGWFRKPPSPIVLPADTSAAQIPRALRTKLTQEPTLLPTYGWPKGTTIDAAQRPDWSWRVDPIFDLRPDEARPLAIQPLDLDDPSGVEAALTEADAPNVIDSYHALTARHQYSFRALRNSRQILFRSNFGAVRFERRDGVLHAIHEMYTAARKPNEAGTEPLKPELFVLHEAALASPGARRPEDGLQPLEGEATA